MDTLFKIGTFDITPYLKDDGYSCVPSAKSVLEEYDDSKNEHHRILSQHTRTTIVLTLVNRPAALHYSIMSKILANLIDGERAECTFLNTTTGKLETATFHFPVEWETTINKYAKRTKLFNEFSIKLEEY